MKICLSFSFWQQVSFLDFFRFHSITCLEIVNSECEKVCECNWCGNKCPHKQRLVRSVDPGLITPSSVIPNGCTSVSDLIAFFHNHSYSHSVPYKCTERQSHTCSVSVSFSFFNQWMNSDQLCLPSHLLAAEFNAL